MLTLRETNISKLSSETFDVLIVGGGINGAVSAAALAKKGVKVALIDKKDFASETSSNSSNLAWGGIKYLENHDYFLVNKLCKSRNQLMKSYPSTVREIRFLTTLQQKFRHPTWFVYLGTIFYWFLGRCYTSPPTLYSKEKAKKTEPVIDVSDFQGGFEYSDAFLHDNDARFVFNFIRNAMDSGAVVANYVASEASEKENDLWLTKVTDQLTGETKVVKSKVLINACGPHADAYNQQNKQLTENKHLFSKGVHLIVDKLTNEEKVLAFFASDGRLFFVIPMGQKTCIGTTDDQVSQPNVHVTDSDRNFILDNANRLLDLPKPLTKNDIISERCGVRPLVIKGEGGERADWVKQSRKHAVEANFSDKYLSIFGGKLTDCLNIGEEICTHIKTMGVNLPFNSEIWFGESSSIIKDEYLHRSKLMALDDMTPLYSSEPLSVRLWRRYDFQALQIIDEIQRDPSQAEQLIEGAEYIRAELHYAARREMITTLEDFLRRRSKIEMVVKKNKIINSKGIKEACEILFGDKAEEKFLEYLNSL